MKTFSALFLMTALAAAPAGAQGTALGALQQGAGAPPAPWHVPVSTAVNAYARTFTFQSGAFSYASDAQEAMQRAVSKLGAAGHTVIESRRNGTAYTLVFMAPGNLEIKTYSSGAYTYASDAQEGLRAAVAGFEAAGRVVLEAARNGTTFRISYLETVGAYGMPPSSQLLSFESEAFTYVSDAREALAAANSELTGAGYTVAEARLRNTKYYIAFFAQPGDRIENYTGGPYTYGSDAREALARAASAFRSRGKVLLAASVHGQTFRIAYIEKTPNYWSDPSAFTKLVTFESGAFSYMSYAREALNDAARALNAAGCTVVEGRVANNKYTLVFIAPERAAVESFTSGNYGYGSYAREAMAEAAGALTAAGKTVIEAAVLGTTFRVSYLDIPAAGQFGYVGTNKRLSFQSGDFAYDSYAREAMTEAAGALRNAGYVVLEARVNQIKSSSGGVALPVGAGHLVLEPLVNRTVYTLTFIAPERASVQQYASGSYSYASQAREALDSAAAAMRAQGKVIVEARVSGTRFFLSYVELAPPAYTPYPPYPPQYPGWNPYPPHHQPHGN